MTPRLSRDSPATIPHRPQPRRIHRLDTAPEFVSDVRVRRPAAQRLDQYPHQFSGGMRQRVMIAMGLSCNPRILIADEPTTALDVTIQDQILALLMELQEKENMGLLLVSHDMAVIAETCDRVAVMYLGALCELAPASALYEEPKHPYTRALLSAVPVPVPGRKRESIQLQGEIPSPLDPPSGCKFHPRCPDATEICREQVPEFKLHAENHYAACWHPGGES